MSPAIVALVLLTAIGQNSTQEDSSTAKASLERMVADLYELEFSLALEPARNLALSCQPVLRWSNPVRNVDDAAVFVLLYKDQPELIATVMSYRDGRRNLRRSYELLSISPDPLEARRNDTRVWRSEKPGFQWRNLPGAPAPADTAAQRRRQMRELAGGFRVAVQSDKNRYELRLLSQPLYRYESAEGKILDGALFALVEGTDPELILSLQAGTDEAGWKYAFGRMTRWGIEVRYQDKVVGELPQITGARDAADDIYQIWDGGPLGLGQDEQARPGKNR